MRLRLTPPLFALLVTTASCADLLGFKPGLLVGTGGSSVASASSAFPEGGDSGGTESAGAGAGGKTSAGRAGRAGASAGAAGRAGASAGTAGEAGANEGGVAGAAGASGSAGIAGCAGMAGSMSTGGVETGGKAVFGGRPVTGGKPATGGRPAYGGRAAMGGRLPTGGAAACEGTDCPTGGSGGFAQLTLPSYMNNQVCTNIVSNPEGTTTSDCISCCSSNGYADSSFIYYDRCTCADLPASDPGPCGAVTSSIEWCSGCCQDNGFSRASLGGSCVCSYWSDTVTCADTLSQADPGRACANCCLEHGNLAFSYAAIPYFSCGCGVK